VPDDQNGKQSNTAQRSSRHQNPIERRQVHSTSRLLFSPFSKARNRDNSINYCGIGIGHGLVGADKLLTICGIGIGHGLVGADKVLTICGIGIGHGLVGAERALTDICGIGIGHGLVGAERALTDICGIGIGHGLVGAAMRTEAAEMSRIAVRARRTDFFTGGPFFHAHNCA
jgi:hypothetical protein